MKKGLKILFIFFIIISLTACGSKKEEVNNNEEKVNQEKLLEGKHYVEIVVKNYGTIKLELDADTAPITVTNFMNLVDSHFYDGLTFHRIMEGFMIQGGGYTENGNRRNTRTIKGEFKANGVENNISHVRGVISMARVNGRNDSASSEFFITNTDSIFLDGNYAAFGKVISGMEVVDKITKDAKPVDNNGSIPLEERPIIETIRKVEE